MKRHICAGRYRDRPSVEEMFWARVKKGEAENDCWLWVGSKQKSKAKHYGSFCVNGKKNIRAHRFSWELHNGPIPSGVEVCHNCPGGDNTLCVNPSHLFLGSHQENVDDAVRKGLILRGENQPNSKLTDLKVLAIMERSRTGEEYVSIAKDFGVSGQMVGDIVRGKYWRHIPRIPSLSNLLDEVG